MTDEISRNVIHLTLGNYALPVNDYAFLLLCPAMALITKAKFHFSLDIPR